MILFYPNETDKFGCIDEGFNRLAILVHCLKKTPQPSKISHLSHRTLSVLDGNNGSLEIFEGGKFEFVLLFVSKSLYKAL